MLIGLVRLNYKDDVESTKTKLRFNKEIKEHDQFLETQLWIHWPH